MSFLLTPVTGEHMVGRRSEIDRLVADLSDKRSRIGVSLTGPRRVGKTSLLMEAKSRLEAKGIVAVYATVWRTPIGRLDEFAGYLLCQTLESFRERIGLKTRAASLLAVRGGALADFFKGAKITAEVEDSIAFALSFARGEESDVSKAVSDVFMLPDKLAAKCGRRCVLIIDEFPALADLKTDGKKAAGESIIRAVRTFNEEYGRTVLALSGSIPGAAKGVASSRSAPFYRQLSEMEIKPFGRGGVSEFVSAYLGDVRAGQDGIDRLLSVSGGLPYNLQVLGREIARTGGRRRRVLDAGLVDRTVGGVVASEGRVHFEAYLAAMQPAEISVAYIMAGLAGAAAAGGGGGCCPCRPQDIARSAARGGRGLGMNKATALLSGMLAKGVVSRAGAGRYRLTDPLFGAWLAGE